MTITLLVGVVAIIMIAIEGMRPRNRWPKVIGWWGRAIFLNGIQIGSVFLAGIAWDRWFPGLSLWSADSLGTTGAAIVGYLVITFIYYWWHRWRHESDFLWRWFHQIHHSASRIEVITSFYKHPFEILVNSVLSSAILYLIVGTSPEAASLAVLLTGFAELFYHWNVKTPYWLGFIIQRPESHCIHHQRGLHKYNYSDLPLWDMLFGTFHNPRSFEQECGFENNRELELKEMLIGHDVLKGDQPSN